MDDKKPLSCTGGVGEMSFYVKEKCLQYMRFLGQAMAGGVSRAGRHIFRWNLLGVVPFLVK